MTEKIEYININGSLEPIAGDIGIPFNRAFQYGDGLFESMHAYSSQIQLFDLHYKRLIAGMRALRLNIDEKFKKNNLIFEIERLLKRNKHFRGTRVKLTVFRYSKGLYTPEDNNALYVIETRLLPFNFFKLNDKGLTVGIYPELRKPINFLSPFKTCNALINVLAGIYAKENEWDDCFILNENNLIVESYHSNVFVYKNNQLYTPGVESGCVMGVMRETLIHIASQMKITIKEVPGFKEDDLLEAEEIFLTNAVEGIRWVLAFKNRRYFSRLANALNEQLNTALFSPQI